MAGQEHRRYARRSESQLRRLIAGQQESGLSVTAYCRLKYLSQANFYRWRTRLKSGPGADRLLATGTTSPFVDLGPVALPQETVGRFEFRIEIGRLFTLSLVRS